MKLIDKIAKKCALILIISMFCANTYATPKYEKATINNTVCYIYYVQPGEGFYSIGKKFGVTRDDVVKFNPSAKNGLNKGQKLYIPIFNDQSNQTKEVKSKDNTLPILHTVKKGESLYSISKQYNISINEIKSLNNLNSNSIKVGEPLIVGTKEIEEVAKSDSEKEEINTLSDSTNTKSSNVDNSNVNTNSFNGNKVTIDGVIYNTEKYVVKRRETLYSISQKFNTTVDAILACNPNLRSLRKDDILNIPMTREVANIVDEYISENKQIILTDEKENKSSNQIDIAVILPFNLNKQTVHSSIYLDYYKGLLLALDSLKSKGLNATVYTFDNEDNVEKTKEIIQRPEMVDVDIIFGPDKNEDIEILSDFARTNSAYLVNSFSVKNREYENNPHIIQGHIPSSMFFSAASKHFIDATTEKEVIFLIDNTEPNDKQDFADAIGTGIKLNGREYKKFSFNEIDDYTVLEESIEDNSDIVFIASSSSKSGVAKSCAIATRIKESKPNVKISIFGYPEWQTYIKDYLDTFHSLNVTIFTRFYSDLIKQDWKDFNKKFNYWFGDEKSSMIPASHILGFDTGMYLINGMLRHGNNFEQYLETISSQSLQTDFSFSKPSSESGFVNNNLYFITFMPDYKIVKEKIK